MKICPEDNEHPAEYLKRDLDSYFVKKNIIFLKN